MGEFGPTPKDIEKAAQIGQEQGRQQEEKQPTPEESREDVAEYIASRSREIISGSELETFTFRYQDDRRLPNLRAEMSKTPKKSSYLEYGDAGGFKLYYKNETGGLSVVEINPDEVQLPRQPGESEVLSRDQQTRRLESALMKCGYSDLSLIGFKFLIEGVERARREKAELAR